MYTTVILNANRNEILLTGPLGYIRGLPGELVLQRGDREERHHLSGPNPGTGGRIADLVGAIRGEHALEVDGAVAARALAVSLAALESIAAGTEISL